MQSKDMGSVKSGITHPIQAVLCKVIMMVTHLPPCFLDRAAHSGGFSSRVRTGEASAPHHLSFQPSPIPCCCPVSLLRKAEVKGKPPNRQTNPSQHTNDN